MPVYPEAGTLRGILEVLKNENNNNKCDLFACSPFLLRLPFLLDWIFNIMLINFWQQSFSHMMLY